MYIKVLKKMFRPIFHGIIDSPSWILINIVIIFALYIKNIWFKNPLRSYLY